MCVASGDVLRSGKRILIANTDAEGRLAMLDVLCQMKEMVRESQFRRLSPSQASVSRP